MHERILYWIKSGVYASGIVWMALHYGFARGAAGQGVHRWEPTVMEIHGAFAMAALMLLGSLVSTHVARAWRARLNLASGISAGAASALLVLTGYLLYYAGNDSVRAASSVMHMVLGALGPLVLVWHVRAARRLRS